MSRRVDKWVDVCGWYTAVFGKSFRLHVSTTQGVQNRQITLWQAEKKTLFSSYYDMVRTCVSFLRASCAGRSQRALFVGTQSSTFGALAEMTSHLPPI